MQAERTRCFSNALRIGVQRTHSPRTFYFPGNEALSRIHFNDPPVGSSLPNMFNFPNCSLSGFKQQNFITRLLIFNSSEKSEPERKLSLGGARDRERIDCEVITPMGALLYSGQSLRSGITLLSKAASSSFSLFPVAADAACKRFIVSASAV